MLTDTTVKSSAKNYTTISYGRFSNNKECMCLIRISWNLHRNSQHDTLSCSGRAVCNQAALLTLSILHVYHSSLPFKDEAQTALFKDEAQTALFNP